MLLNLGSTNRVNLALSWIGQDILSNCDEQCNQFEFHEFFKEEQFKGRELLGVSLKGMVNSTLGFLELDKI